MVLLAMEDDYFTERFVEIVKKPDAERSDQVSANGEVASWPVHVCVLATGVRV